MNSDSVVPYPRRATIIRKNGNEGNAYELSSNRSWWIMLDHEDSDIQIRAYETTVLHTLVSAMPKVERLNFKTNGAKKTPVRKTRSSMRSPKSMTQRSAVSVSRTP